MPYTLDPPWPSPTDPRPRWLPLELTLPGDAAAGRTVTVQDDAYSDRIRCDHPDPSLDGEALGQALIEAARTQPRGRVMVMARARQRAGLTAAGLRAEAVMPGFYAGEEDCVVMGAAPDPARDTPFDDEANALSDRLVRDKARPRPRPPVTTERATEDDAPGLAALIGVTFEHYPTPSGVPDYVAKQIREGIPFRLVREAGEVVACASADMVWEARTAELTDCSTRPDQRGRGLMQAILLDLMDDMRELGCPTAFTLARARIPGVNLAFARLGFAFRGRQVRSCRIGDGLEDMNVRSRWL